MTHFFTKNGRELGRTIRRHEIGNLPKEPKLEDVRPYLHTHDNLIEYNEIHNVMEKMGDGNGIYIRGAGAGNLIRRNYIHHLVTPMLMQAAIRTDGGQRDTLIAENLIYKCMAQGIILKLNNCAENNIVADVLAPPRGYYLSLREGPLTGGVIKRNIFYSINKKTVFIDELAPGKGRTTEDRRGRTLAKSKDADTDYNIYYCAADSELGKTMLEKQRVNGVDVHSLAIDPLFVDPENGDFRLKPNSPALKLGFVPFDISKVGLHGDGSLPENQAVRLGAIGGFRIASAGSQQRPASYPRFSWDTVPVAFHFGKSSSLMTEAEVRFVASRSNFICLEKGHAARQFGDTETGIEKEAQQLKRLNPEMKVIFYWNTFLDYSMFKAHEVYQRHPEWWLKTLDGKLDKKKGRIKRYDLSNPDVRKWWTDVAQKAVVEGSCDGVFMDAFPQITHKSNIALWGQGKYDAIQQGLRDVIKETRQKIGKDKLIVYNGIRSTPSWKAGYDFPDYTDAAMIEHFGEFQSTSKECMLKDILEMDRACKNGKIVVFKGWPGFTFTDREAMKRPLAMKREIARKSITFPLAAFLVGAQKNSYFVYNWGYRMENGCLEWYPEFDKPLGEPLGDMVKEGWTLSREFKHASVRVNLETREAKINWRKTERKRLMCQELIPALR